MAGRPMKRFSLCGHLPLGRRVFLWSILLFVVLMLLLNVYMFRWIILDSQSSSSAGTPLNVMNKTAEKEEREYNINNEIEERYENEKKQKENKESMLLQTKHLLSLLEQFSNEHINHIPTNTAAGNINNNNNTPLVTPKSLLEHYYKTEITRLNNLHERTLDDGYAENVLHSDTYWSPSHVTRRGYGLEGSIFIGVTHNNNNNNNNNNNKSEKTRRKLFGLETECAATVKSIYDSSRWPLGVFVGAVEMSLHPTIEKENNIINNEDDMEGREPPAWISPPVSACIPRAYLLPSCAERPEFCPTDNIRIRQVRVNKHANRNNNNNERILHRKPHPLFSSLAAQRWATLSLYRGETYVMFLHAGGRLVPAWDILLRLLWLQLPPGRSVLSHAPVELRREHISHAWEKIIVKHIEGTLLASQYLLENTTISHSPASAVSGGEDNNSQSPLTPPAPGAEGKESINKKQGNGVECWINSIRWALNVSAAELHPRNNNNNNNNEMEEGLTEEEVLKYIFHYIKATSGEYNNNNNKGGGKIHAGDSSMQATCADGVNTRRCIQLYWLKHFHDSLRQLIVTRVMEENITSCLSGVQVNKRHSQEGAEEIEKTALFSLHTSTMKRLSYALKDMRYMEPSFYNRCGEHNENRCTQKYPHNNNNNENETLPYLKQSWITTQFLFARAEVFFDFPNQFNHHDDTASGYNGASRMHADSVQLDPYLSFLSTDEESVLLSARLWTHGWDFFSPTEPIVFSVTPPHGNEEHSNDYTSTLSPTLKRQRMKSIIRLRHILFGSNNNNNNNSNNDADVSQELRNEALRDVEKYGLGKRRSREEMLRSLGLRDVKEFDGENDYVVDRPCRVS